jgi:hypothetical protein
MSALANTAAAAAPAPAPGPAPGAALSNDAGAEDLVRVMGYIAWAALAGVQAAALLRAGPRLSCAGSGEAVVAPVAVAALVAAAFWAQGSAWGTEHATLRVPLHAQLAGVVLGFVAAALFASTHWHLGTRATQRPAAGALAAGVTNPRAVAAQETPGRPRWRPWRAGSWPPRGRTALYGTRCTRRWA